MMDTSWKIVLLLLACANLTMTKGNTLETVVERQLEKSQPWEKNAYLPKDVIPINYDIFLNPDIDLGIFSGKVNIALDVGATKDHIIVHTKHLNVTSSQVFGEDETSIPVKSSFEYTPNEFWIVTLDKPIGPGKYTLSLEFSGSLTGSLEGFYRSTYKKPDGTTSNIATTKFEPTFARRAFPCFDEPAFKATFSTKLVKPAKKGYIALSNMNQIGEKLDYPKAGLVTVEFAKTPLMSTYLACFIVCDFDHLPTTLIKSSGTPLTVYARDGQVDKAKHAEDTAVKVLNYFNEYFEIKYPLPKLDLIAVPDFVSGAMENWGLITFRESRMLADLSSSATDLHTTANVVSHELAHMWFGDIVTMGWWDDLWLNEGFATFLANAVLAKLTPDYPVQDDFALHYLQSVMIDDATVTSHPIIRHVSDPAQITEAFDAISYQKGASVLRMIEDFDSEGFRKAVVHYLKAHTYGNANTSDLWAQLSVEYKAVDDVTRMLDTWTKQMGFPLVKAVRTGNKIELQQQRCLSNINADFDPHTSTFEYRWDIPIKYVTSTNKNRQSLLMKLDEQTVSLQLEDGATWFKINAGQVGFYRVLYTNQEWDNLFEVLLENPNVMSAADRANLIDDAFALAKAGYLDYSVPLKLISYVKSGNEKDWAPWSVIGSYYSQLKDLLYNSKDASQNLDTYFARLIVSSLNDSMWSVSPSHPARERLLYSALIELSCSLEWKPSLERANKMFLSWMNSGEQPPIDFRPTVFSDGIKGPNLEKNWMALWDKYIVEEDPLQKETLQSALVSVTNSDLILRLLKLAQNESSVRSQDYFAVVIGLSRTPQGNSIVWDWTRKNWDYLVDRFTVNHRQFGRLLPALAFRFYTNERLQELEDFIEQHPQAGAGVAGRKKAVEITKANIRLYNDYQPILKNVLKQLVSTQ